MFDNVLAANFGGGGERMGWNVKMQATRRSLSDLGYRQSGLPGDGKIIMKTCSEERFLDRHFLITGNLTITATVEPSFASCQ